MKTIQLQKADAFDFKKVRKTSKNVELLKSIIRGYKKYDSEYKLLAKKITKAREKFCVQYEYFTEISAQINSAKAIPISAIQSDEHFRQQCKDNFWHDEESKFNAEFIDEGATHIIVFNSTQIWSKIEKRFVYDLSPATFVWYNENTGIYRGWIDRGICETNSFLEISSELIEYIQ